MTSFPKSPRKENPALLKLARGKPCLMQAAPDCLRSDTRTTVAAHSNELRHGKGRGMKAHDHYSVWSCANCHRWYDEGSATREEKRAAFEAGHNRQLGEWVEVVNHGTQREAQAAQEALSSVYFKEVAA